MKVERYFVFCGESYYPAGGWHDFEGSYDTLDAAEAALLLRANTPKIPDRPDLGGEVDWGHVVFLNQIISELCQHFSAELGLNAGHKGAYTYSVVRTTKEDS